MTSRKPFPNGTIASVNSEAPVSFTKTFAKGQNEWIKSITENEYAHHLDPKDVQDRALIAMNLPESDIDPKNLDAEHAELIVAESRLQMQNMQEMENFAKSYGTFRGKSTQLQLTQNIIRGTSLQATMSGKYEKWSQSTDTEKIKILEEIPALTAAKIYKAQGLGGIGLTSMASLNALLHLYPEIIDNRTSDSQIELSQDMFRPLQVAEVSGGVSDRNVQAKRYKSKVEQILKEKNKNEAEIQQKKGEKNKKKSSVNAMGVKFLKIVTGGVIGFEVGWNIISG